MKTRTRKNLFILAVLLFVVTACDKSENELKDPTPFTLQKENYTLFKNSSFYNEAKNNRSESYSASFEIESVERVGNNLNINIVFQEGCTNSKYEIIWDGLVMESYPPQARIFVKRTVSDCIYIDAIDRLTLTVDLNELAEKNGNDQIIEAIITVSNASKKQNTDNSDFPVSNN